MAATLRDKPSLLQETSTEYHIHYRVTLFCTKIEFNRHSLTFKKSLINIRQYVFCFFKAGLKGTTYTANCFRYQLSTRLNE